jgi:hypothetical protein
LENLYNRKYVLSRKTCIPTNCSSSVGHHGSSQAAPWRTAIPAKVDTRDMQNGFIRSLEGKDLINLVYLIVCTVDLQVEDGKGRKKMMSLLISMAARLP